MKQNIKTKDRDEGRRGVAILIVIAMLSTLMLAASAFSISMRLERKSAANYRHSVVARHLLWGALSMAINEIDKSMDPEPDSTSSSFEVYPDWLVMPSVGPANIKARVMTEKSKYYIPGILRQDVITHTPKPEWIPVNDSNDAEVGRCSYMVVNVSGLLDGNMVGGTNRGAGVTVKELQPSKDMLWTDSAFETRNKDHHRYESLYEMSRINEPLYTALGGDDDGYAHVFSCSTEGQFMDSGPNDVKDKVYIGGDADSLWADQSKINPVLERCGFALATDRLFFLQSLMDYVDEDCEPRLGPNYPNAEAFPMINELPVVLLHRPNRSDVRVYLKMEFTYPFLNARPETFEYDMDATYTLTYGGTDYSGALKQTADVGYASNSKVIDGVPKFYTAQVMATVPLPNVPTTAVDVVVNGTVRVMKTGDTTVLDELSGFTLTAAIPPNSGAVSMAVTNSWECGDPRFNWDFTGHWRNRGPTHNKLNEFAANRLIPAVAGGYDDDYLMYVADSGTLRNVGELGCILENSSRNYMYKTLRTYGDARAARIFEEFTVAITNANRRGLVNVNSTITNVWTAIFRDAPLGAPDDDNLKRISGSQAQLVGAKMANHVRSKGPFLDISTFMTQTWANVFNDTVPGMSSLEKEMVISSTAGLLTSRQNTFIILLAGEKYVSFALKVNEGKSMASMYAVATVSRDPFRDPVTKRHKMFVRSFTVLAQ